MLAQLLTEYPQDLRFVYRHFPLLSIHDKAALAAQASEAAGAQGEFWAMHDILFEYQLEWATLSVEQFHDWLLAKAEEVKLDITSFEADLNSTPIVELAQSAWEEGQTLGIPYTPFLVVNGQAWSRDVPPSFENLSVVIKLIKLEDRQFDYCPPMTIDSTKQYFAILHTEKGDITLELYPQVAPLAVNSFIFLARHGWYDGVTFHRVIPGFVAQAGDPSATGFGSPGYAFDNEISADLRFDQAGILGMANAGPGSNGSQFYITLGAASNLDGKYTIFGRVIAGMDVLERISPRYPQPGVTLPPGDVILSVNILEK